MTPLRAGDGTLDEASTHWLEIDEFPHVHLLDTLGDIEADATRAGLGRAMSVVVRSDGPRPTRTYVEHMSDPAAHATRAARAARGAHAPRDIVAMRPNVDGLRVDASKRPNVEALLGRCIDRFI